MISKCLKEANDIILWFCNSRRIHDDKRDEYFSAGMFGLSVAINRYNNVKYKLNTYTAHFVRGYLQHHHRKVMGWERNRAKNTIHWSNFHEPADFSDHENNLSLSRNGIEAKTIAKDLILKVLFLLSPRQKQVFELMVLGYGPSEIGRQIGVTKHTVNSYRVTIKEKINKIVDKEQVIASSRI